MIELLVLIGILVLNYQIILFVNINFCCIVNKILILNSIIQGITHQVKRKSKWLYFAVMKVTNPRNISSQEKVILFWCHENQNNNFWLQNLIVYRCYRIKKNKFRLIFCWLLCFLEKWWFFFYKIWLFVYIKNRNSYFNLLLTFMFSLNVLIYILICIMCVKDVSCIIKCKSKSRFRA